MNYITITPSKVKNRYYVARKAVGSNDFHIVAECTSQDFAKRIAMAMNAEPKPYIDVVVEKVTKLRSKGK